MTVKIHAILQLLLTILQGANFLTAAYPHAQPFVAFAITMIQGGLALLAHYTNPDGSPALT
jgi:hypothetical protein